MTAVYSSSNYETLILTETYAWGWNGRTYLNLGWSCKKCTLTYVIPGFMQSILYEMLYKKVFGMKDAMTAANEMIYGNYENGVKP